MNTLAYVAIALFYHDALAHQGAYWYFVPMLLSYPQHGSLPPSIVLRLLPCTRVQWRPLRRVRYVLCGFVEG